MLKRIIVVTDDVVYDHERLVISRPPKDPARAEWARRARLERFKVEIPRYEALAAELWPHIRFRRK